MTDNLYTGAGAREKIMVGVRKAAQAVGVTMGTSGSNSLIECLEMPFHYPTNDGVTILKALRFADPLEDMGRRIVLEAVERANKKSGDGSSTTTVLTAAILEEGMKHIGEASPMEIKRSLEDCLPLIEKSIKEQTKEITVDNVAQVASISAEDDQIGALIQEIYQKIGKEGVIHWDISKTSEDSYTIGSGITVHGATYASPYMCDIDESGNMSTSVRWKNPKVLLCKQKISSAAEFNDLFQALFAKELKEVVVFCEEIEVPVIADLIRTRAVRGFKTVVIKMPVLWRDEWWEDLALASGATVVDPSAGLTLRKATEEHLGTFGHITVTKEDTFIDGVKDLKKHILALQVNGDDQSLLRASRLNTKTARYFVGGHSESAIAYRRLKVEDAINAASCALDNGVVVGGGVALVNASEKLPPTPGGAILREALKEPLRNILKNAGMTPVDKKEDKGIFIGGYDFKEGFGFNTRTMRLENLMESGVVDPADVVLTAVKNAIGVAASVLTIGTVVLLPREEKAPI
jgi:chaperonin GroEL